MNHENVEFLPLPDVTPLPISPIDDGPSSELELKIVIVTGSFIKLPLNTIFFFVPAFQTSPPFGEITLIVGVVVAALAVKIADINTTKTTPVKIILFFMF